MVYNGTMADHRQRTFDLIPESLAQTSARPVRATSKTVKKMAAKANKLPKVAREEQRRREQEELRKHREEYAKQQAAEKAKANREKKAAKALMEKAERKKKMIPETRKGVRPSQARISMFVQVGNKRTFVEMEGMEGDSDSSVTEVGHDVSLPVQVASQQQHSPRPALIASQRRNLETVETGERPTIAATTRMDSDDDDEFGEFPSLEEADLSLLDSPAPVPLDCPLVPGPLAQATSPNLQEKLDKAAPKDFIADGDISFTTKAISLPSPKVRNEISDIHSKSSFQTEASSLMTKASHTPSRCKKSESVPNDQSLQVNESSRHGVQSAKLRRKLPLAPDGSAMLDKQNQIISKVRANASLRPLVSTKKSGPTTQHHRPELLRTQGRSLSIVPTTSPETSSESSQLAPTSRSLESPSRPKARLPLAALKDHQLNERLPCLNAKYSGKSQPGSFAKRLKAAEAYSVPPSSTQAFIENNLDNFFPSPTQEARELAEPLSITPHVTKMRMLPPSSGNQLLKLRDDEFTAFICTQDLMSSQEIEEMETPRAIPPARFSMAPPPCQHFSNPERKQLNRASCEANNTTPKPPCPLFQPGKDKIRETSRLGISDTSSVDVVKSEKKVDRVEDDKANARSAGGQKKRNFFEEKEEDMLQAALRESARYTSIMPEEPLPSVVRRMARAAKGRQPDVNTSKICDVPLNTKPSAGSSFNDSDRCGLPKMANIKPVLVAEQTTPRRLAREVSFTSTDYGDEEFDFEELKSLSQSILDS